MIETLVRPFQTPLVLGTQSVDVLSTKLANQTAILIWGVAGTIPPATEDGDYAGFKLPHCDTRLNETKRVVEEVRVQNPDDPTQFVMVERIKSITMSESPAGPDASWVDVDGFVHDPSFGSNPVTSPCEHVFNLNPPAGGG